MLLPSSPLQSPPTQPPPPFASLSSPVYACFFPCDTPPHQGLICRQPGSTFIYCCCPAENGTPRWDRVPESSVWLPHLLYDLGQSLLPCVLFLLLRHGVCSTHAHVLQSCYWDPGDFPRSAHWKGLQVGMEEIQLAVPRMRNIWGMS